MLDGCDENICDGEASDKQQNDRVETKNSTIIKRHLFDDVDGFNDEDLEKPNFPGKQSSEKVPFILSDVDDPSIVQVPSTINQYLREYQKEGIAFLYRQYSSGKGAILADDMGLGKTVQVIAFISAVLGKSGTKLDTYGKFLSENDKAAHNQVKKEKGTFLIVSPNSVLYNWHDELMTWGYFKIGKFHNTKRDETFEKAALGKLDVVLTTYETLRNHWETLNRIKWLAVIMDEVHHLKDPKRAVTIASKSLNVKCRIGLTGTPLQNRLLDFWSVLDWANPGCLGDKDKFTYGFSRPIMQGQRFDGTKRELATGRKKTMEFQSMIDDWCLRRTKTLIADQLPKKDQKVVFCPLSKVQEDIYKTLLQTNDVQLVLKQGEPCDCRSELTRGKCCYAVNEEGSNMKKLLLQYLRLFLKVSNHAALLLPQVKQTDDQHKRANAICKRVFAVHPEFEVASKSPSFELFSNSNFCGKMKVLDKLLKLFRQQKDKVLLFSYSTQLLDMLEAYVISCGMVYRRLDGKTRGERRLGVVREFNTNPDIFLFLVSTKAGGVGLNLTSANIVIVFDPSWNPANDLQAEDRAYRIGQRRDVKVFRLISSGSVEENMYLRQIYKQQLANVAVEGHNERRYFTAVDGEKDRKGELFGIENLFAMRNDGCSVSTDIFKRSDKIERGFRMTKYELQPTDDAEQEMKTLIVEPSTSDSAPCREDQEEEEEENSYNLEEITSQFIEDETTNMDCNKPREKDDSSEVSPNTRDDPEETKQSETNFTKLLDISHKIDSLEKRLAPSHCEDIRKRQKNKQGANHSRKLRPSSKDSQVNLILEECGVQHTHSNKMIIGTSEAENEMTSRAMKEVFGLGQYSQQPANCFAAVESDGEESDDIGERTEQESSAKIGGNDDFQDAKNNICPGTNKVQLKLSMQSSLQSKVGGRSILFGETPKTLRLRQFTEISQAHGYKSEVEFARAVVSGNTAERLSMLMGYYKDKDYPNESILSYSQAIQSPRAIQSSQDSGNSKENGKFTKRKGSVLPGRHCRKSSTKEKLFTNVFKAPVIKSNKTDKFAKKRSKCLTKTQNAEWSASNIINKTTVKDKVEQKPDRMKSCESSTVEPSGRISSINSADTSLGSNITITSSVTKDLQQRHVRTKSVDSSQVQAQSFFSPTGQVCEEILSDILTTCSDRGTRYTQYHDPSRDNECTSNTPPLPNRPTQSSSFLDEFLFECQSQRTQNRTANDTSSRYETRETEETNSCRKIQTSVIDDLI